MKEYIMNVHGFQEQNITVLMDDGKHTQPTRANILAAYQRLVDEAEPGDSVFCHYSGENCWTIGLGERSLLDIMTFSLFNS